MIIPFVFNLYSSLLLPFVLHAVVMAILLLIRGAKEDDRSFTLFGWILLVNGCKIAYWMLGFAGWFDAHNGYTSFMYYFPFNNMILVGPLLYFYFHYLTNRNFRFLPSHRKHLVIPVLWLLLIIGKMLVDFLFNRPFDPGVEGQFGTKGPAAEWDKLPMARLAGYLVFFYYCYRLLKDYRRYQAYLRSNFSNPAEISFSWLRNIIVAIGIGCAIVFIYEMIDFFSGGISYKSEWVAYFLLGMLTYYAGIQGYNVSSKHRNLQFSSELQEEVRPGINDKVLPTEAPINQQESNDLFFAEKLARFLEEEKPFLDPELTLADLAKKLRTNTSTLSRVINDRMGNSFNDLVNTHRVNAVKERFDKGDHATQTILSIAFDSGFNSKSTFNRAFKKVTGLTPVAYIDNQQLSR